MKIIKDIALGIDTVPFLEPYLRRELTDTEEDEPATPRTGVMIVTDDAEGAEDTELKHYCDQHQLPLCVIRCPYVVGTGMTGLMHRIAGGIYKGTYINIKDNAARISVVHAIDVARAVALCAGTQGTYTLTDGHETTINDLADAFAYRLGDKRIITIKPRWAKWWYGAKYFGILTSDHVAQDTFCQAFPDFHPVEVTQYLRTHVYDEKSL